MKKLRVLCPQEYESVTTMNVVPCDRCTVGWNKVLGRCTIATGAESFESVAPDKVPVCPIQDQCQHQVQSDKPCEVRRAGMICESALVYTGMSRDDAADHSLAFNDSVMDHDHVEQR